MGTVLVFHFCGTWGRKLRFISIWGIRVIQSFEKQQITGKRLGEILSVLFMIHCLI